MPTDATATPPRTVWWLTLFPSDGPPMHVRCDGQREVQALLAAMPGVNHRIDKKSVMWTCDGRDGCTDDA